MGCQENLEQIARGIGAVGEDPEQYSSLWWMKELDEGIGQLLRSMKRQERPIFLDRNLGRLRVQVEGLAGSMTLATVTTVSNIDAMANVNLKAGFIDRMQRDAWNNSVRSRIKKT